MAFSSSAGEAVLLMKISVPASRIFCEVFSSSYIESPITRTSGHSALMRRVIETKRAAQQALVTEIPDDIVSLDWLKLSQKWSFGDLSDGI
jgi:hypothetical protein